MVSATKEGTVAKRPVPTFDHLAKKKPLELREWIPLDGDANEAFEEAKRELQAAEMIGDDDKGRITRAREAYNGALEDLKAHSVEVVFRGLGRPTFESLKRKCPPTPEAAEAHKAEYGFPAEYDEVSFAPILIAASCVQPRMSPEQVQLLIEDRCEDCDGAADPSCPTCHGESGYGWNAAEYANLFQLALRVNTQRRVADLGF